MSPDEYTILYNELKEHGKKLDGINDHLATLNSKVLKHDISINGQSPDDCTSIYKRINVLEKFKSLLLKNIWWISLVIIVGLMGTGGIITQMIEGWVKRGMPG
jgi:hypothetical protein